MSTNANVSAMAEPQKSSFLRTVKAVAWSFIGIRKNSEYQQDLQKVNPFHIIAVAIVGVALFIAALVVLVNWVVAK